MYTPNKSDKNLEISIIPDMSISLSTINIMEEINNFEQKSERCIKALAKFCTYDKRNRRNYQQKIDDLFR